MIYMLLVILFSLVLFLLFRFRYKTSKIAVVTYENRPLTELIELHNRNMNEYCNINGYYYYYTSKYDPELKLPVYWKKLQLVKDILSSKKYKYVMWMDTDAFFAPLNRTEGPSIADPKTTIESIINLSPTSSIFIGKDEGQDTLCSGVFIIKNNGIGNAFVDECINHYINNPYCKKDGKYTLAGEWAGICYEQGVMNFQIFNKYKKYTYILPEEIVYNGDRVPYVRSPIIHIFGDKNNSLQIVKNILFKNYSSF